MVTEVTHQGWFSRIIESIKGILVGTVLVLVSIVGLFFNEHLAVKTARTLEEVGGNVVTVLADAVDAGQEGKLVHLTGTATSTETLTDELGASAQSAIALRRRAQMYQWKEHKKEEKKSRVGGGQDTITTYTYDKVWDDSPIPSGNFKERPGHENPSSMPFTSRTVTANVVTVGARQLSADLVREIEPTEPLPVASLVAASTGNRPAKPHDGGWHLGQDPANPQVGDVRVHFFVARPQPVSLISGQQGKSFAPWLASTGQTMARLQLGTHTSQAMVAQAEHENTVRTWILRGLGWFLMVVGFGLVFQPLVIVADVLPLFGSIAGLGAGLAALGLGSIGSFFSIGVAWIVFRPLIGVPLVLLGVALFVALIMKGRKKA